MPKESRCRNRIELLQGTLDLLVLRTLRRERLSEAVARALSPREEEGGA